MKLTSKVFAAGALAALIGFPISSALAQSPSSMADKSASASASATSINDSSASASSPAAAASASTSMGASASASSPAQSAQIDDATLQKAAKAYVKVKQIVHETKQASSSSASAAPDQASSQKLAAVKNEGLDPQQYDQVIQTVQNDPQLQQKFAAYVNQNGGDTD